MWVILAFPAISGEAVYVGTRVGSTMVGCDASKVVAWNRLASSIPGKATGETGVAWLGLSCSGGGGGLGPKIGCEI